MPDTYPLPISIDNQTHVNFTDGVVTWAAAGSQGAQEAAGVTETRVRCSAWLGVSGRIGFDVCVGVEMTLDKWVDKRRETAGALRAT